jgi:integrase
MPPFLQYEGYDKTIESWLEAQKTSTRGNYKSMFKLVCEYPNWLDSEKAGRKLCGAEILASKQADKNYMWEKNIIHFKGWVKTQKSRTGQPYGDNSADCAVNALRSFFDYYRAALNFSQSEARKINERNKRNTTDYILTNDVLKKMVACGDLREKYIVLVGKSVGQRAVDFVQFTWGTFRSIDLTQEAPIFIGEIITIKEGVPAFPFLDTDSTPIVQLMLDANKDKPDNERIIDVDHKQLTPILQKLAKTANIPLGGKHLRFHCLRKYLIDRLTTCMSESKWKQIVGKTISESAYVSPLKLWACYREAMKLTSLSAPIIDLNLKKRVEDLEKLVAELVEHQKQLRGQLVMDKQMLVMQHDKSEDQ